MKSARAIHIYYYAIIMLWHRHASFNSMQVTLPDGTPPRWAHSATAISLCPGLEEVNLFGGSHDHDANQPIKVRPRISETTILTFGEFIYTWVQ